MVRIGQGQLVLSEFMSGTNLIIAVASLIFNETNLNILICLNMTDVNLNVTDVNLITTDVNLNIIRDSDHDRGKPDYELGQPDHD